MRSVITTWASKSWSLSRASCPSDAVSAEKPQAADHACQTAPLILLVIDDKDSGGGRRLSIGHSNSVPRIPCYNLSEPSRARQIMKGNPKVIELLNEVLKAELTAISQYFLHAEMMENWGYHRLADLTKKESIDEMRHAEMLMERILFLDGMPKMHELFPLRIGQSVKGQIENDLALELEAVARLNLAVKESTAAGDNSSRELFESILNDEEEHVDFLEAQLQMIQEMGIERYLARQMA